MRAFLLACALLWSLIAVALAQAPSGGPLLMQNSLSEIAARGTQATTRVNLGLGSLATLSDLSGLDASSALITGTGSTAARTAAARGADAVNVRDYGAQLNAVQRAATATIAAGSNTLSLTSGSFTAADIGKRIVVLKAGTATTAGPVYAVWVASNHALIPSPSRVTSGILKCLTS
jgi:hypothetical protein